MQWAGRMRRVMEEVTRRSRVMKVMKVKVT
jgi:hypothetical protein